MDELIQQHIFNNIRTNSKKIFHKNMRKLNDIHCQYNKNSPIILTTYAWNHVGYDFSIMSESSIHTYTIDNH